MPATISLAVKEGFLKGERFVFERPGRYILGRADCCNPKLPNNLLHRNVSRFHCLIDICSPHVWVRDMGSRNGTFVNGENIGQRECGRSAEEAAREHFPEHHLRAGDEVRVGDTVFRVEIGVPADDVENRTEVLDDEAVLVC
jgi:pSer/pThr/pTyr-binding forkhead associated (FHA) protein